MELNSHQSTLCNFFLLFSDEHSAYEVLEPPRVKLWVHGRNAARVHLEGLVSVFELLGYVVILKNVDYSKEEIDIPRCSAWRGYEHMSFI